MNMDRSELEKQYGRKTIIQIIDDVASNDPGRAYAKIPRGDGHGYRTITAVQLATAVSQAAWWLDKHLAPHSSLAKVVGYIGPQDLRYVALALGAVKTGRQLFLPALGNGVEANVALLDAFDCSVVLTAEGRKFHDIINSLSGKRSLTHVLVAEFAFYFDVSPMNVPQYPWEADSETVQRTPFVAMHSSGSTGAPKPVQITLGYFMAFHALRRLEDPEETFASYFGGRRQCLVTTPFFHASGLLLGVMALAMDFIVVLGPPEKPMGIEWICSIIDQLDVSVGAFPPSFLSDMNVSRAGSQSLSKLDCAFSGGAPVPSEVGDQISRLTRLVPAYGGTEFGVCISEHLDQEDWAWIKFPDVCGVEMRLFDSELYECVFVRKAEFGDFQVVFMQYPHYQEWPTKDLFVKHSTKPGLWRYYGRTDDVVVLSSGLKFNPVAIEDVVNGHVAVKGALVCGSGRHHSSMIIELHSPPKSLDDVKQAIETLWPTLQRANSRVVELAWVRKDMIFFTTDENPFPRAGKGSIQRRLAMEMHAVELDLLYGSGTAGL